MSSAAASISACHAFFPWPSMVAAQILARYFPLIRSAAYYAIGVSSSSNVHAPPIRSTHLEEDGGTVAEGHRLPLWLGGEGGVDSLLGELGTRGVEGREGGGVLVGHRLGRKGSSSLDLHANEALKSIQKSAKEENLRPFLRRRQGRRTGRRPPSRRAPSGALSAQPIQERSGGWAR